MPKDNPKPKSKLRPFSLPKPNRNADRVIAYLRGRGISQNAIYPCIKAGILYESNKHRCVFVGKDDDNPKFACERGTDGDLKKDVSGSDKRFSFSLSPEKPSKSNTLAIFESPIDCLAHFTIHEIGQTGWDGYRLSLGGVSSLALNSFLERNPGINEIYLCLDSDKAGRDATTRIVGELISNKQFSDKRIIVAPPPIGKDYADTAKAIQQFHIEKSKTISRPQGAVLHAERA
jgi:hypothetical protein